ncbi:MAG TPA: LLM class flavin-dependent oxidoreductase [Acidimicrobiales bacterium]|nr:LLM class flavin-dependent oxidoreductase [Acidimicrobiales bacterium]
MAGVELWITSVHVPGQAAAMARRAEADGFDGIGFGDTQNLAADPYIGLVLAAQATTSLRLGIRVANPVTRDAAAVAAAIATVQVESGGRAVLGVGRGDSSVSHVAGRPASVSALESYVEALQGYFGGGWVFDADGSVREGGRRVRPLGWLPPGLAKVPVDVAATGLRTMAVGARLAEDLTVNVGADPARLTETVRVVRALERPVPAPPLSLGAYVNVVPHPDRDVARDLVKGPAAAYARFSGLAGGAVPGAESRDREVLGDLVRHYDPRAHGRSGASHVRFLTGEFLSRFAVFGSPEECVERLVSLVRCGVERLVIVGPAGDGDPDHARLARQLLGKEVVSGMRDELATAGPASRPVQPGGAPT